MINQFDYRRILESWWTILSGLVVIGAGVAGLISAALAAHRGASVTVIEAGQAVGGLWRSNEHHLGDRRFTLDAGLRLPVATGVAALDDPIFYRPDFKFEWHRLRGWPCEGAITEGAFNPESSCIDATRLDERVEHVLAELRGLPQPGFAGSAAEANDAWFGPTLSRTLARDALLGMFNMEPVELSSSASSWFLPRRLVFGDPDRTSALLADERLAGHVAHARHVDLPPATRQFLYPTAGGISTWIAALRDSLERSGVEFVMGDGVANAIVDGDKLGVLRLKSGRTIAFDAAISTIAPGVIAKALGAVSEPPPLFRHLCISHTLVDRPPAHRARYGLNFSRNARFFRAIFHDNAVEEELDAHIITFEHIVEGLDTLDLATAALEECRRAGAIPRETSLLASSTETHRNALPVPTVAAARAAARVAESLRPITNLRFIGRSAGGAAFLDGIIREADREIERLQTLGQLS